MKVTRRNGITIIEIENKKIRTNKINRFAYNRLRKAAKAGKLKMYQVIGAMSLKK